MSLDLVLFPNAGSLILKTWEEIAILRVDRDGWAYEVKDKCPQIELPSGTILEYNREIYERTPRWGTRVTYALTEDLLKVKNKNNGYRTQAAFAYLRSLDSKTPVALLFF